MINIVIQGITRELCIRLLDVEQTHIGLFEERFKKLK